MAYFPALPLLATNPGDATGYFNTQNTPLVSALMCIDDVIMLSQRQFTDELFLQVKTMPVHGLSQYTGFKCIFLFVHTFCNKLLQIFLRFC